MTLDPVWDRLSSYATPYVIWANDSAAEVLDWESAVEALDLPQTTPAISAAFLGATVLELTGHSESSPWFSFLNDLRRAAPVVQKNTYLLDGNILLFQEELDADESDEALRDALTKWRQWSYYKLKYQEFES